MFLKKNSSKKKTPGQAVLARIFSIYFWVGLLIICVACILDLLQPQLLQLASESIQDFLSFLLNLLVAILQTVGIAVMLGAIFDFSKNSEGFIDFISKILSDIVVGKNFLSKLDDDGKKDTLSLILRPSENQITQYSRIDDYFTKKINESMKMWDTNFKTNMVISIDVSYDAEQKKVVSKGKMTHRIYKVKDRYEDIFTVFERKTSNVSNTRIIYPGGIKEIEDGEPESVDQAGIEYSRYIFRVPEELYKYPYLTIERDIFEPGYDHWTNFHWTSLTPYDGLVFSLHCFDDLTIKEHIIFDEKQLYNVTISDARKQMRIVSTDWLDANTGFSVTISNTEPERNPPISDS